MAGEWDVERDRGAGCVKTESGQMPSCVPNHLNRTRLRPFLSSLLGKTNLIPHSQVIEAFMEHASPMKVDFAAIGRQKEPEAVGAVM